VERGNPTDLLELKILRLLRRSSTLREASHAMTEGGLWGYAIAFGYVGLWESAIAFSDSVGLWESAIAYVM
jgi:hypothetical protein